MKKLIATLLLLSLTIFAFVSCSSNNEPDNTQLRIGYLTGPTGVGMAKLIKDNNNSTEKYSFKSYVNDSATAMADLKTNKIDIICMPTNAVPNYYTKNNDCIVLSINTLNTLFFLTDETVTINSLEDLEGQTIYTCEAGTPKLILKTLLKEAGVKATIATQISDDKKIADPEALKNEIVNGNVPIAFAPEPIVSASAAARQGSQKTPYAIALSCNEEWKQVFGEDSVIAMGCIVANKTFVEAHTKVINNFLDEYEESIEFMSSPENIDSATQYVVNAGILPNAKVAKSALSNLGESIAYIDGDEMKSALEYLFALMNITLPDDSLYYEK